MLFVKYIIWWLTSGKFQINNIYLTEYENSFSDIIILHYGKKECEARTGSVLKLQLMGIGHIYWYQLDCYKNGLILTSLFA